MILADEYLDVLKKNLKDKRRVFLKNTLQLLNTLFQFGSSNTQQQINNKILINDILLLINNKDQSISDYAISLMRKIIVSIGYLNNEDVNADQLIEEQFHVNILPIIHLNCKCPFNITFHNQQSIYSLISAVLYTLSRIFERLDEQQINELNDNNHILNHIICYIEQYTTTNYNNQSTANLSSFFSQSLIESNSLQESQSPLDILCNGLNLLTAMISKSKQITQQIMHEFNNLSSLISCSGGSYNNFDKITEISVKCLVSFVNNETNNQYSDLLKEKIEQEGINEENENLLFQQDQRKSLGVIELANILKDKLK